jgi:hypothetical protein
VTRRVKRSIQRRGIVGERLLSPYRYSKFFVAQFFSLYKYSNFFVPQIFSTIIYFNNQNIFFDQLNFIKQKSKIISRSSKFINVDFMAIINLFGAKKEIVKFTRLKKNS